MHSPRSKSDFKFLISWRMEPEMNYYKDTEKPKLVKLLGVRGIEPSKKLEYKERWLRKVNWPTLWGIESFNWFLEMWRTVRWVKKLITNGILLDNLLAEKSRYSSLERLLICRGMISKSSLLYYSQYTRWGNNENENWRREYYLDLYLWG